MAQELRSSYWPALAVAIYKATVFPEKTAPSPKGYTFTVSPIILWALVGSDILIVMLSLPAIGPFVRAVRKEIS